MNTSTAITTAARKIAAATNARPSNIKIVFDAAGNVLDSHPKDMWYTTPQPWDAQVATWTIGSGKGHMTYRAAQDLLDAAATDDPDFYLYQLDTEREIKAGR